MHNFLRGLLALGIDWFARGIMRTGSLLLTRRAKLDALSSAIRWIMRQQNNQPLQISHDSAYGDMTLMSDGELIQLTWRLIDYKLKRYTAIKSRYMPCEVPCDKSSNPPPERQTNTVYSQQSPKIYVLTQTRTATLTLKSCVAAESTHKRLHCRERVLIQLSFEKGCTAWAMAFGVVRSASLVCEELARSQWCSPQARA